jgi:hypothetical protein
MAFILLKLKFALNLKGEYVIQEELEIALAKFTKRVVCKYIQHVLLLLDLLQHTLMHA